jgi:hypothetical protein
MVLAPRTVRDMPDCLSLPVRFAASVDDSRPDEKSPLAKFRIAHPLLVSFEIVRFGLENLS